MTTKKPLAAPELIAQQEILFGRAITETPALVVCIMAENGVLLAQLRMDVHGSIANVGMMAPSAKEILDRAIEGMNPTDPEFMGLIFVSHCPDESVELAKLGLAEFGDALGYRVLTALHVSGGLIHNIGSDEIYERINPGSLPEIPGFSDNRTSVVDRITTPAPKAGDEVYSAMAMGQAWATENDGNTRLLAQALNELADSVSVDQAKPFDLHRMAGILRHSNMWATALVSIIDPELGKHGDDTQSLEGFLTNRSVTPDWERVDRIQEALTQMAEIAPAKASAPVVSALAWIQWCKGRSSVANELLEMSFELAPGYGDSSFMQTLELLFKSGTLSPVALNSATAYRGTN